MSLKDVIRSWTPAFLLEWNRARKKAAVRDALDRAKEKGEFWTQTDLMESLKAAGVERGRDLMVHSSLSKIGYVQGGPASVVAALMEHLGPEATLLMPTSPVVTLQAEHPTTLFDVAATPSKMGSITEYFRVEVATHRSGHPLEPVAAVGPRAEYYTQGHHTDGTAYGPNSPWNLHMEGDGQILYIGTTLINSGTSLHVVEDAVGEEFSFPVYLPESKTYAVRLADGRRVEVTSRVHNPEVSAQRKCDGLIPLLEREGALRRVKIGQAPSLWVDAGKMKSLLLKAYYENGVTMYTPEGA